MFILLSNITTNFVTKLCSFFFNRNCRKLGAYKFFLAKSFMKLELIDVVTWVSCFMFFFFLFFFFFFFLVVEGRMDWPLDRVSRKKKKDFNFIFGLTK